MRTTPCEFTNRAGIWTLAVAASILILSGGRPPEHDTLSTPKPEARVYTTSTVAEDQIFNEGSSAPSVSASLVEGGLSAGSVGGTGVIDASADFADPVGEDAYRGTSDDDLLPAAMSAAIDAGDNSQLPPDRFDLDEDGDTSEPLPVDFAGYERATDGGSGTSTVDLGALEFAAMQIARDRAAGVPPGSFRLESPYPNPAATGASVKFVAGGSSHARLAVYDLLGREVLVPFDGAVAPGNEVDIAIDVSFLSAGLYMIRLKTGSHVLETRLTVAR